MGWVKQACSSKGAVKGWSDKEWSSTEGHQRKHAIKEEGS